MIKAFCNWLAATHFSQLCQTISWIVPSVQSVHILAVSVVMASMAALNLRLLGLIGKNQSVSVLAERFLPGLTPAILILATSGLILTIAEPARELLSSAFRLKMLLLVCAIVVTLLFRSALNRNAASWETVPPPAKARITGFCSLALWVAIASCGRWIAYTQS